MSSFSLNDLRSSLLREKQLNCISAKLRSGLNCVNVKVVYLLVVLPFASSWLNVILEYECCLNNLLHTNNKTMYTIFGAQSKGCFDTDKIIIVLFHYPLRLTLLKSALHFSFSILFVFSLLLKLSFLSTSNLSSSISSSLSRPASP